MFIVLPDTAVLNKIFVFCCVVAAVLIVFTVISAVFKRNEKTDGGEADLDESIDIVKYPSAKIVKPIVPKFFTWTGMLFFILFFGLSGLLFNNGDFPTFVIIIINLCFALAAEVAASNLKYAHDIRTRKDVIFVPRLAGVSAKVCEDVPAGKRGEGLVRAVVNGKVCEIRALSTDEVTLASGTDVVIMYAYSDCSVVVERKK